jgi:RNA polymerase sigma-70 factor (ECF subfamily)
MLRSFDDSSIIQQLKSATGEEQDRILANYIESLQTYLRLVADRELPSELRAKVSPSDIVQNTYIDARKDLKRFAGRSDRELLAWLCCILLNNTKDITRHYLAREKRQVLREVPLEFIDAVDDCPAAMDSPLKVLCDNEDIRTLRRAISCLSPEHREVVNLRSLEHRSFAEIADIMQRSEEAVRKLFARAVSQLQRLICSATESG